MDAGVIRVAGRRAGSVGVCALAAVALTTAAAFAAHTGLAKPGKYSGTTSEKGSIAFTVSASRKTISAITSSLGYNDRCGQGGGPGFSFAIRSASLSATGRFAATVTSHAGSAVGVVKVSGVVSGASARGTIMEPKPFFTCRAPDQKVNPYSETFTAKTS